jgi:hypothetical protein
MRVVCRDRTLHAMKHLSEAEQRLGVRIHALAFVVTLVVLVLVNVLTGPPYWVGWVVPGWTVGLFCHWYFGVHRGVRGA